MWPHEFDLLWRLSLEPMTASELSQEMNRFGRGSGHETPLTIGTKLKGHVRRGFLVRDESLIYRLTEEGRAYVGA